MHNTAPGFCKQANASVGVAITAANTKSDGSGTIGTDLFLAMTADATNGSLVEKIKWMPTASVAGTATTGTVGRAFLSSVTSGAVTAATCTLLGEVLLSTITAANSTAAVNVVEMPIGMRIPAGWCILVSCHAAPAANTAWKAIPVAGDY